MPACSSVIELRRYDRNHLAVTLRGIQKVTETRHKREADYHTLRMTKHVRFAATACFPTYLFSRQMYCPSRDVYFPLFAARRVRRSLRRLKETSTSFRFCRAARVAAAILLHAATITIALLQLLLTLSSSCFCFRHASICCVFFPQH